MKHKGSIWRIILGSALWALGGRETIHLWQRYHTVDLPLLGSVALILLGFYFVITGIGRKQ